jgi:SAM-dependent methyltransferase
MRQRLTAWAEQKVGRTWLFPRHITQAYMRPLIMNAADLMSGRLLDIGCGRRPYEDLLAHRLTRYVGMEGSATSWSRADLLGDALDLPFSDGSFEVVLATEVMEHLPDSDRFLSEVGRVLSPGGVVVVSVPFMEPLHEEPLDFYRFTPYGLRVLLERHGFESHSISARGGWWSVVLGSFVSQALYDAVNPRAGRGRRRSPLVAGWVLPVCAIAQLAGYGLDRLFRSRRYALGHLAVARKRLSASPA